MTEKHVHKLRRHVFKSGNKIFFCTLPDCNYKIAISLALGKRTLCNRCGEPFILNDYSIRLAKPHCDNCHKPKETKIKSVPPVSLQENRIETLAERLAKVVNDRVIDFEESKTQEEIEEDEI